MTGAGFVVVVVCARAIGARGSAIETATATATTSTRRRARGARSFATRVCYPARWRSHMDARRHAGAATAARREALARSTPVHDLVQLAAFECAAAARIERSAERTASAERRAEAANEHEARRRDELVSAHCALDVVEAHDARWKVARV